MPEHTLVRPNPWTHSRVFTDVRIALGHASDGQTTNAMLAFSVAYTQACGAVHLPPDGTAVTVTLEGMGLSAVATYSVVAGRAEYPCRPDPGRHLDGASHARFGMLWPAQPLDAIFAIADGLSTLAVHSHTVPLLCSVCELLPADWPIGPVAIAGQSRVALGDEISALLGVRQMVMLVGERSRLSSPDSLSIHLTYAPRTGRSDAGRSCISDTQSTGQAYDRIATRLVYPLNGALVLDRGGVDLRDDTLPVSPGAVRLAEPHDP